MGAFVALQSKFINIYDVFFLREDLIITLDALLSKKNDLEYILVETNGLTEPS